MYKDYVSYLMDDKMMSKQMPRERWLELDEARPYGASLRQDIPRWPWATRVVVSTTHTHCENSLLSGN